MPIGSLWPTPSPGAADAPPSALLLSEDDFLSLLQNYLPRGAAWPRDTDAILTLMLRGIALSMSDTHNRQSNLLVDAFPTVTAELLPDWEASLGLPDPCAGEQPLVSERRSQVVARLANIGGQSAAYFIDYAAKLGFAISIENFAPSRFGRPFGGTFGGVAWAFTWQVHDIPYTVRHFQFGGDTFGTPFADWTTSVPQCELQRLKPAHTMLLFDFS